MGGAGDGAWGEGEAWRAPLQLGAQRPARRAKLALGHEASAAGRPSSPTWRMVRGCSALPIMIEERQAREASMARTLRLGWRRRGGGDQ